MNENEMLELLSDKYQLQKVMDTNLKTKKYSDDKLLKIYLQADIKDFIIEVSIAAQNSNIQRVVVL